MLRNRDDSDPLVAKRRLLEQQERLLAEKRRLLKEQLENGGAPAAAAKVDQPPVWRMEDEPYERPADPTPARKRHLAHQRQRDMILFFACIGLLLVVLVVLLWVAHVHVQAPGNAA